MKDKKIIYASAILSTLLVIIAILLIGTLIETGSFDIKADSITFFIVLILSPVIVVFNIAITQIQGYKQIAMIRSVEINKFISYDDLNDLQLDLNLYRDIINSLNKNEWNKVCEKYYKLKQQEEKPKEPEYCLIMQNKIDTILKNCD